MPNAKAPSSLTERLSHAELTDLLEEAEGGSCGPRSDEVARALRELQDRRGYNSATLIRERHPDGVMLEDLRTELGVSRSQLTELVVQSGIGRRVTKGGSTRLLFNSWETDYVYSAGFHPGLLTPAGAEAVRDFVKKGVQPKLRGR